MARRSRLRFGPAVAELLEARGWTQRELAVAVAVDPSHVCRLLGRQARPVTRDVLVGVARAFDVPPEYFLEYREWRLLDAIRRDPALCERLYRRVCKERTPG